MWNFDYIVVMLVISVTLCQGSPIEGIVPIMAILSPESAPPSFPPSSEPPQLPPSLPPSGGPLAEPPALPPSVHAASNDMDYYEDQNFVFNDADHYENLGCDAYGYAYEDY